MNTEVLIPLLLTACVAVAGWYAAHRLSARRDLANKRRELRVQYLIEAYRRLEFAGNRPLSRELAIDFERAVADVQLFGTPTQVQLAQEFALGFAAEHTHPLDPLLNALRQELRKELKLEPVPPPIKYLRITIPND